MVHQSDALLTQLATMAVLAVLIWEALRQVPEPWQGRARSAYLLGLMVLYLVLIGGFMETLAYTIAVTVVMFVIGGALGVWLVTRRGGQPQEPAPLSVDEPEADDAPVA